MIMGKVISLVERRKKQCADEILEIINILEDYDISIYIKQSDILFILNELYNLYLEKQIIYQFLEDMQLYFNEICRDILEENEVLDFSSLSNGFMGCYDLMVPIGIEKEEFSKVFQKAKAKINDRRQKGEE